ncbi:MAG: DUF4166 domain-containing protein [Methylomonas sp.]
MSLPLMQKVLGDEWHKLPGAIQKHYQVTGDRQSRLQGVMNISYPGYLYPLVWIIHLFGGLVLWRGERVQAEVDKTSIPGDVLDWRRTMTFTDGKTDYFRSQMHYSAANELIETISFGFGLRLRVEVINGDLRYRSNGHFFRWGKREFNIPDWMMLGSASISEHAVSEDEFYLDFTIEHPLLGVTYYYRGNFRYA